MQEGSFWLDAEKAAKTVAEVKVLKSWIVPYRHVESMITDLAALVEDLAPSDSEMQDFFEKELIACEKQVEELEVRKMLSKEMDPKNCYFSINAGAGGTESCDWVQMLSRMYQRWMAQHEWKVEILDFVEGDVAGLKSITFKVEGPYAYGYAKAERGVHRLVRISPFDSNAKRHTSFASVDVSPDIDEDINIEIRPEDIRIDTYRASGAGGQHVNKTDSAVRITHLPSGIVVSCQNERSQLNNKESCFKMLKAKLYEKQMLERESQLEALAGEKKEIAWGSQIRNYVFQPYTLVKDTRTKFESGNVQDVMDGNIDPFVIAYLKEFG
jgi:peptide chain release factor 2